MISNCLKPLCKNAYTISETETFSKKLSTLSSLKEDEEDVSDDVRSLFINIQTIDYTIDKFMWNFSLKLYSQKESRLANFPFVSNV